MQVRRLEPILIALFGVVVGIVCVQLAYRTHPVVPLVLVGAAGACLVALWRPMWLLYAAVALIPLELISVRIGGFGLSPAEAAFLLTGLGWAGQRIAKGEAPWSPSPVGIPLALLVVAAVPGVAIVDEPFLVWKLVVVWSALLLIYQMIVTEGDEQTIRNLLFALAISGGIVGAIAIGGSAGNEPELVNATEAEGRATGSFGHPNTLATFLGLALPGALALGLTGRLSWRPVALVAFAAMLLGLALSLSRGGLLAVAGALGIMLLWAPVRRATIAAVAIVVLLYAGGAQPLGESRQIETVQTRVESIGYSSAGVDPRFGIWEEVPNMAIDSMPLGVGANNFPEVAARYGLLDPQAIPYEHAHNIALTFLIELGILGLVALLWATVVLARVLWRAYTRAEGQRRGLVLAVAGALVALTLQGMVDYTLRMNVIVALIFALAGAAVVLDRASAPARPEPERQPRATAA
jgi:O-antigen ligase